MKTLFLFAIVKDHEGVALTLAVAHLGVLVFQTSLIYVEPYQNEPSKHPTKKNEIYFSFYSA